MSHLLTSGCQIFSPFTIDCNRSGIVAFAVEYLSKRIKSHSWIVGSMLCHTTENGLKTNNLITNTTHTINTINVARSSVSMIPLMSRFFWFMYVRYFEYKKDSWCAVRIMNILLSITTDLFTQLYNRQEHCLLNFLGQDVRLIKALSLRNWNLL
jgi:hypothetical protein